MVASGGCCANCAHAERNNRVIAERFRAYYHMLPYKKMPKIMTRYLAMVVTQQLNLFPVKGGISEYYSPHVILGGAPLDYKKHCQIAFGASVQACNQNDPTNTNAPRMIDAIYLRPLQNAQGGHELMDLNSGRYITRHFVTEIPVTQNVINAVEKLAELQNVKSLKFKNRHGVIFHPADWIAGVEYVDHDNNDNEDEADDEEYEYDEDQDTNIPEDDVDDEEYYDHVDQSEVDELLAEHGSNPIVVETVDEDEDDDDEYEQANEGDEEADDGDTEPTGSMTDNDGNDSQATSARRSTRATAPPKILNPATGKSYVQAKKKVNFAVDETEKLEYCHNLIAQVHPNPNEDYEYHDNEAMVFARCMTELHEKISVEGQCYVQQYLLNKGLKEFGDRGAAASSKEMDQLHKRNCFTPISIKDMNPSERKKAQEALMFLSEKRDGTIKGRMVYNGKPTRQWLSREDSASPTASLESIMITAVIDAKEGRDVMTADVPNAFIQTHMPPPEEGEDRVIMKITGVLVDMLVQLSPDTYGPYVVYEKGRKVLYVQVLRAIYGMLQASLLWYNKFRGDLEAEDFEFNPYDPCVANKNTQGSQHTVRFHVDDLMSSHMNPKVNSKFLKWLNSKYGSHGDVKATRGKKHDFLGMNFDFSTKGKVRIDMKSYVADMIDSLSEKITGTEKTAAAEDLFAEGNSEKLNKDRAEEFHTTVAKGLFVCKRARPDIQPTIAVLCTRVKAPNESDWDKLIRLLKFLNGTREDVLTLSADDLGVIKWYVDSAFAVHPDFKSHTGATMTYGTGAVQSLSRKQKLNTRSSTESELVGADDGSVLILWTKLFIEAQGYKIKENILYQDNKSTILLIDNGKRSSSKRTRALNIRYFFLTDQVEKGNLVIKYCPTGSMIADFQTKPLQGAKFDQFRSAIMGFDK